MGRLRSREAVGQDDPPLPGFYVRERPMFGSLARRSLQFALNPQTLPLMPHPSNKGWAMCFGVSLKRTNDHGFFRVGKGDEWESDGSAVEAGQAGGVFDGHRAWGRENCLNDWRHQMVKPE